ncbi:Hypothetical protein POVR1_LOCUS589 [uncultured virus]|nr:Hypothetical protein POVR1_LOCUS589 [uncultured virus]
MDKFVFSAALETLVTCLVDGYQLSSGSLDRIFQFLETDYPVDGEEISISEYSEKHKSITHASTIYLEVTFPTIAAQGQVRLLKLSSVNHTDPIITSDIITYQTHFLSECPVRIHPIHWRIWQAYQANNLAYQGQKLIVKLLIIQRKGMITFDYQKDN